jgi:hypothetical protein
MKSRVFSLLFFTLLTVTLPAQASDWYPIDTGRFWVYASYYGEPSSATVEAPDIFLGSPVQPLRWNTGHRELLSTDEAGRVFQHGSDGDPDGNYGVYDPPILLMDSGLTPGHEWEANFDVIQYNADGEELWSGWKHLTFHVIGVGPVDVPAGTFVAAEVLVTGESSWQAPYTFRDWYAEGVGWIRRTREDGTSVLYELESYGPVDVPVDVTTWGAIKSLFR